ncbi:bifunctional 4-hydroxy-2-oxoglutarate aldolase/2-dehydro-3-deoxy-phosphogluconate aldolase [Blastococcus sp. CT_GayMR20]|uniref:bifunctional 4-hydroxy-2-oxoglutarate aldolase/2-dehydro-3-deoxy-phosphogluconate aldolase n=1 Tax=Blastococcus sp. CT_GayMR20 TaxID=2559609 RepID=UPI0010742936|nr:bifunctional 4-hydroxy-2-oxoglutarate aldolase/2-dehydro-3-deoxy-phosphogluconate aldolase [Blastococcus sp. CT_GayMR20]TFV81176.1 bifunctional 4-hydroxy-2-oxoglutarate aldolase/2-dehydro-3-deoxy-phosphogluconate aldolase [Blastococcus sp. CT_GayMR20]
MSSAAANRPAVTAGPDGADLLRISPVIPVVVLHDVEQAVPVAQALVRGGVRVIEITLRTPVAVEAIHRVAREVPEMHVGAGTVITPEQAVAAKEAGSRFLVTPGCTARLLDAVLDTGLPVLAGASTLTEMLRLAEYGLRALKFFPAEASGGRAYLAAVQGPLPGLIFCPTGGVTLANAPGYLALPNVACVGGSWLTPPDVVDACDWTRVEHLARQAASLSV